MVALNTLTLHEDKTETEAEDIDHFAILSGIFQLTESERIILLFAVAREAMPQSIKLLNALNETETPIDLNLMLIMGINPKQSNPIVTPIDMLRRWQIISLLEPNAPLVNQTIKLDEQILHFILGRPYTNRANRIYLSPVTAPLGYLPTTWQCLVDEITTLWQGLHTPMQALLIGRKTFLPAMLSSLCSQYHIQLQKLAFAGITDITKFWQQLPSINRDAHLFNLALYIDLDDSPAQIDPQKFIHHLQEH